MCTEEQKVIMKRVVIKLIIFHCFPNEWWVVGSVGEGWRGGVVVVVVVVVVFAPAWVGVVHYHWFIVADGAYQINGV